MRQTADPAALLSNLHDDERLGPLLRTACHCLIHESALPDHVEPGVDTDFGNPRLPPLHARLRLTDTQNDAERQLCLRAIQRDNATAFQARLKAALTASGIAVDLPFRRLLIVRSSEPPSGPATDQLLAEFRDAGGRLVSPTEDDLRTLWAMSQLESQRAVGFADWLRLRRPVSSLTVFQNAIADWVT